MLCFACVAEGFRAEVVIVLLLRLKSPDGL